MSNSVSSLALADLVEPFGRHPVAEQRIVSDPGEQQRFGSGCRCSARPRPFPFVTRGLDPRVHPLGEFDELGRTRCRVAFYPAALGPRISCVVVSDITKQQARGRSMDDQPDVFIDANRPEIRVARPFEPMKAQAGARQVQLQVERRRLDRLLLGPVQPGEAGGKRVGDAEIHHCTDVVRASRRARWALLSMRQALEGIEKSSSS